MSCARTMLHGLALAASAEEEIIALLGPIIEHYAKERQRGEHFGDFVLRAGYLPGTHAEP